MKQIFKRFSAILLAVVLLIGITSVPGITVFAEDIITGSLVTFGRYPQTIVTDETQLEILNSESLNWIFYDYYVGGVQEDYMEYADVSDVFESGDRYRAVRFSHYRPYMTTINLDEAEVFYQAENGYEPDTVYWFKYEPIVWRVLDADTGLLMSESIVDSQAFNNTYYEEEDGHYVSNWAYSSLRSWMNEDFYTIAFDEEKSVISEASLTTPSSVDSEYNADPTVDRVFLLSFEDALNEEYGFSADENAGDANRIAYGTDYAECQGLCADSPAGESGSSSGWRLRNADYIDSTYVVESDGSICDVFTDYTGYGIRPALNVDLQSAVANSLLGIVTDEFNADRAAAESVEAKINAIGTVEYTDVCREKIDEARDAYDALTEDQKTLVTNYGTLTAAEAEYAELKAGADALAAEAVETKIEAIGEVEYTDACKAKIDEARDAYDALTDDQKELVSNYGILTAAENEYAALAAAAGESLLDGIEAGTLVDFGQYPQTRVTDETKLGVLNAQTQTLNWTYYDYYFDGAQENYMEYADVSDVFRPGDRYRAVRFSHYRPCWTTTDSLDAADVYQDENGYEPGVVYWFRYEPIVWRVLDTDTGLLMSESIVDSQAFNNTYYEEEDGHYVSDWAYSSLRSWMNEDFYTIAFDEEKSVISDASLTTPSSVDSEYNADPTVDRVFLLSFEDALNEEYGFSADENAGDINRIAYGTDYAKCQGLCADSPAGESGSSSGWRLRTADSINSTYMVDCDGSIYNVYTDFIGYGIRPALNVDLHAAIAQSLIVLTSDDLAAEAVMNIIDDIGEIVYSDACKAKIDEAREAYEVLTEVQKALVTNYGTLTSAETAYAELKAAAEKLAADTLAAEAVEAKIDLIGEVEYSDECKDKIDEAREAYNALTEDQKALVSNYGTLTSAEAAYAELKAAAEKLAADTLVAEAVEAKIELIGEVEYTETCKDKIDEAREAYDTLTDDQKALVTNYEILTSAEAVYSELKAAADKLAADMLAAEAVEAKIELIGEVEYTETCKDKIDEAREAYDALTDDQKALVTNYEILTAAEAVYSELKTAAEKLATDMLAAEAVEAKINAIGEVEYTETCKDKIDEARGTYDALTADQKALVTNYEILTAAEAVYSELKAAAEKLAADMLASGVVETKIGEIGNVVYTDACKAKIDEARDSYDALTDDQKDLVTNYSTLTQAEAEFAELKTVAEKLAADMLAAEAVEAKINAIGEVEYTEVCKAKIDEAREGYDSLTADQKALVSNFDILAAAETEYAELKAAAEKLAADMLAAGVVKTKIDLIGEVEYTDACKDKIEEAREAYDALTADQKALVANYDTLTSAESEYAALKTAAEKLAADKAVFENVRESALTAARAKAQAGDSAESAKLIADATDAIAAVSYDESRSVEDNTAVINAILEKLDLDLAARREAEQITEEPAAEDNIECKWCGRSHTGFFGKIIGFFHNVLYFFSRLKG